MSQLAYKVALFEAQTIAAGETAESAIVDVNSIRPLGNFASQFIVSGEGTVKAELYLSIDGTNFVLYDTLFTGETKLTAPLPGKLEMHVLAVCLKFKVKLTETSGADSVTVSHYLGVN